MKVRGTGFTQDLPINTNKVLAATTQDRKWLRRFCRIRASYRSSGGNYGAASFLPEGLGERLSLVGTAQHEQFAPLLQPR